MFRSWSRSSYALFGLLSAVLVLTSGYLQAESKAHAGISYSFVGVPGATTVGSDQCNSCHREEVKDFRNAFHAKEGLQCEDCHGAGSLHVESGATAKIVSFSKRSPQEANAACLNCHAKSDHVRNWAAGAHARNGVRCMDCHQVHAKARQADASAAYRLSFISMHPGKSSASDDLVGEDRRSTEPLELSNENCLRCHQSERAQMNLPSHHPLREGKVGCKDCHDAHGGPSGNNLRTSTSRELCLTCHAEYRGPFAYQHRPVQEDCLICHSAHGSPNTNLLKLSEPSICLQCHEGHEGGSTYAVASPNATGMGGPQFVRCTTCHGSIHGSEETSVAGVPAFLDNSSLGLPTMPAQGSDVAFANAHRSAMKLKANPLPPVGAGLAGAASLKGLIGNAPESGAEANTTEHGASATSVAGSYRALDATGFPSRVGEYDSLKDSVGAQAENTEIFNDHDVAVKSSASIISSNDYHFASELIAAHRVRAGFDTRSLVQQQTTYAFNGPDIPASNYIPNESVYGVERRMGNAYGKYDLPTKVPVQLFVRGNWQAKVGTAEMQYLDQGGYPYPSCAAGQCHNTTQFQPVNQTTRGISGGAEVKLGTAAITYEHGFSNFNDRVQFPIGTYVPAAGLLTATGDNEWVNNYVHITPSNQVSSDTARVSWLAIPNLTLNGDVTYSRMLDSYLDHKGNTLGANTSVVWRPLSRLGLTADFHEDSLIYSFVPAATPMFYAPVPETPSSHHKHWEGLKANYGLTDHLNAELYYRHSDITRSNSNLWCQAARYCPYGPGAAETETNTAGTALQFHSSQFGTRVGYEYINTDGAAFNTDFESDNRAFVHSTYNPTHLVTLTNDFDTRIKNGYSYPNSILFQTEVPSWMSDLPTGTSKKINNHFYSETVAVSVPYQGYGSVSVGYSYQQSKLLMPMDWLHDYGFGLDKSLEQASTPYNQLSQSYFADVSSTFLRKRLGVDARVNYSSARSRFYPDLNPNDYLQLGNLRLVQLGGICPNGGNPNNSTGSNPVNCFAPGPFQDALKQLSVAATSISEVRVPQWIGQGKLYYRLPRSFTAGMLFNYGSYRDYWNPDLNGALRSFNAYIGRSW